MNHYSPVRNVTLPAVPEPDDAVHQEDEGEGEPCRVRMLPSSPAVVLVVSSLVNMEPVLPGSHSNSLCTLGKDNRSGKSKFYFSNYGSSKMIFGNDNILKLCSK